MCSPNDFTVAVVDGALFDYDIDELINAGGQGAVFRARHAQHGECVVKVYTPDSTARAGAEIEFLSDVRHPSIIRIIDNGTMPMDESVCPFVVMPYLSGGSLRGRVRQRDYLSEAEATSILLCVVGAIECLWEARKVHRDIKPDNLLFDAADNPVLIDFGVVRHLDLKTMTITGNAPGTWGYKSPEQSRGARNLTYKSDIFSLGITLYEAVAGQHPYDRRQDLVDVDAPVAGLSTLCDCSPGFCSAIQAMLNHRAIMRPTCEALRARVA